MGRTINGIAELKELVGEHLGYSDYVEITQEQVNLFADATGDHQWIHVDPERAKDGPFGGPIAHGYLTLSLGPMLVPQILRVERRRDGRELRLPARCASRRRCPSARSCASAPSSSRSTRSRPAAPRSPCRFTFEVEGAPKPSCVAEIIFRYYE